MIFKANYGAGIVKTSLYLCMLVVRIPRHIFYIGIETPKAIFKRCMDCEN